MTTAQPWYLSTFAVAEQLYDALIAWEIHEEIIVTATSLAFFRQFIPKITVGLYEAPNPTYFTLIAAIKDFADGFVLINAKYTPSNGGLAEQYTRSNGSPLSAKDLTWSYASALTAFAARGGYRPPTWGAVGLVVPSDCRFNPGPFVSVTFEVEAPTNPGGESEFFRLNLLLTLCTVLSENVFLVGSIPEFGSWSPDDPFPLTPIPGRPSFWAGEYSKPVYFVGGLLTRRPLKMQGP